MSTEQGCISEERLRYWVKRLKEETEEKWIKIVKKELKKILKHADTYFHCKVTILSYFGKMPNEISIRNLQKDFRKNQK